MPNSSIAFGYPPVASASTAIAVGSQTYKATKSYLFGEVKAVESDNPAGEFEVILSMPTLDRDGEVVSPGAFEPLPASVPIHAFHNFDDPVGRARPYYEGDVLKARGFYASTLRAQEIRSLVADGVIAHTSVGFMTPTREVKDGVPHITKGELLEASFVSVSSNREAAVLVAKALDAEVKRGRTLSTKNESDIRQAVALLTKVLEQVAAPEEDGSSDPEKIPTAATPEEKAAAPAAANPPAEVSVGRVWASIAHALAAMSSTG